ncbi:tRNA preQ1(34) S-adenosylmethionine ribosyltransferase-isomerase QueA [Chloroflexota bacterium]
MKTSDFDYSLPPELIAQTPIEPRTDSRLMVLDRSDGLIKHQRFFEIVEYLREGDVLVFNNSLVIPARLSGQRAESGGKLEILLLRRLEPNIWETLVRPARRVRIGTSIEIAGDSSTVDKQGSTVTAEAVGLGEGGTRVIRFSDETLLPELGEIPLPPYIHAPLKDPERYQTVYASIAGSVAAPTAGLHFTPELIDKIKARGIRCLFTTLHVGLDTFWPVRENNPLEHKIHREYGVISQEVAVELSQARIEGRRIICVGTTAVRLVEAVAQASSAVDIKPFEGWVDLFIVPGYRFRVVDALITNFHLPRSTLLMLVTAFAGRYAIKQAYKEAIASEYRFYSFGDAMLIL